MSSTWLVASTAIIAGAVIGVGVGIALVHLARRKLEWYVQLSLPVVAWVLLLVPLIVLPSPKSHPLLSYGLYLSGLLIVAIGILLFQRSNR